MSNQKKYDNCFRECFSLSDGDDVSKLAYQSITEWDSVGHMSLIACLEETFDIMMEMDDIIEFSSWEYGKELLQKYGVEV